MNQSSKNKRQRGNANRAKLKRQRNAKNVLTGIKSKGKQRHTALAKKQGGTDKRKENRAAKVSNIPTNNEATAGLSSKPDKWYKGRNLYPTKGKDGTTIYLPQQSDATPSELSKGHFVKDVDTGKDVAAGIPPKEDSTRGRNLYATTDVDGKTIYLPQKSDATPAELLKGQFVKDVDTGKEVIDGGAPKADRWYKGRNLYPSAGEDGKTIYLPQKSDATPAELLKGQFVKDVDDGKEVIAGGALKKDRWYKGRYLYPTLDENGKTIYLPQKSEATPSERLKGNFVKDVDSEKQVVEVLPKNMKPKTDDQGRVLYPVKVRTNNGEEELEYYPKESEATDSEKAKRSFVRDEEVKQDSENTRRAERAHKAKTGNRNRSNAVTEL